MLFRDVALIAFVDFAPIAMLSWTWSATRHWLRRWIEVVGALLFSKIAMAVVFALGISKFGVSGQGDKSNIGTFMAGILLIAMAAFAPLATFSFIHWVGDHGQAATHLLQQTRVGADTARDRLDQAQQWRADHFGGSSEDDESGSIVGGTPSAEDAVGNDPTGSGWSSGEDHGSPRSADGPIRRHPGRSARGRARSRLRPVRCLSTAQPALECSPIALGKRDTYERER